MVGGPPLPKAQVIWYDASCFNTWGHRDCASSRPGAGRHLHTGGDESQVLQGEVDNGWAWVLGRARVAWVESWAVPNRYGCHRCWGDHKFQRCHMKRGKIHSSEFRWCHRDNTWKRRGGLSLKSRHLFVQEDNKGTVGQLRFEWHLIYTHLQLGSCRSCGLGKVYLSFLC